MKLITRKFVYHSNHLGYSKWVSNSLWLCNHKLKSIFEIPKNIRTIYVSLYNTKPRTKNYVAINKSSYSIGYIIIDKSVTATYTDTYYKLKKYLDKYKNIYAVVEYEE